MPLCNKARVQFAWCRNLRNSILVACAFVRLNAGDNAKHQCKFLRMSDSSYYPSRKLHFLLKSNVFRGMAHRGAKFRYVTDAHSSKMQSSLLFNNLLRFSKHRAFLRMSIDYTRHGQPFSIREPYSKISTGRIQKKSYSEISNCF